MKLMAYLFPVMMVMVLVWFAMLITLFKRLKSKHPEKYIEMREPSLFWNNSMKTRWITIKFLFGREHKDLKDNFLTSLSDSMLVFSAIYLLLFFGIILNVFFDVPFDVIP